MFFSVPTSAATQDPASKEWPEQIKSNKKKQKKPKNNICFHKKVSKHGKKYMGGGTLMY